MYIVGAGGGEIVVIKSACSNEYLSFRDCVGLTLRTQVEISNVKVCFHRCFARDLCMLCAI